MPKLEIINSMFTENAGEWALLFYARDYGAKSMEEIDQLYLAGKGVRFIKSAEPFSKCPNLRKLDISGHPEFFMTEEKKE